jgi:hypothetical protein
LSRACTRSRQRWQPPVLPTKQPVPGMSPWGWIFEKLGENTSLRCLPSTREWEWRY